MSSIAVIARPNGIIVDERPTKKEWLDDLEGERRFLIERLRQIEPTLFRHGRISNYALNAKRSR